MRRTIQRLGNRWSKTRRGLAAITVGALLGQGLLALSAPVLSRIYSPADIGVFSALLAISSAIGPAAALRLDAALMLPADRDEGRRLFRLAMWTVAAVSAISAGCAAVAEKVHPGGAWSGVAYAPFWIGGMILTAGTYMVLTQAVLRQRNYAAVAKRSVTQSLGIVTGQIGLGLAGLGFVGLSAGYLLGRCVGYVPLMRVVDEFRKPPAAGSYRALIRKYWRFPVVFTPSVVLNSLGTQIPLLAIAWRYGSESAGQLWMAQRLAYIPASLLGISMANVFGAELARIHREGLATARHLYMRVSARMALVAVTVAVAFGVLGPWVMPWVLGPEWEDSGQLLQAMALSVAAGLVAAPLSGAFAVFQASTASVVVDLSRVILVGGAFAVALWIGTESVGAAWLLYGAQAANYLFTWIYGLRVVSRHDAALRTPPGGSDPAAP